MLTENVNHNGQEGASDTTAPADTATDKYTF